MNFSECSSSYISNDAFVAANINMPGENGYESGLTDQEIEEDDENNSEEESEETEEETEDNNDDYYNEYIDYEYEPIEPTVNLTENIFYDSYFHEIIQVDHEYMDSEKKTGQYIIGICSGILENECYFTMTPLNALPQYCSGISSRTFLQYPFNKVYQYLFMNSCIMTIKPKIEIIKLYINAEYYNVAILKTIWLRIVQRTWKKIYKKRELIKNKRLSISSQLHFRIYGKYPQGFCVLPTIVGMIKR